MYNLVSWNKPLVSLKPLHVHALVRDIPMYKADLVVKMPKASQEIKTPWADGETYAAYSRQMR